MNCFDTRLLCGLCLLLVFGVAGCGPAQVVHPLDENLARSSVEKAMQAWVEGKTPKDLQPAIVVGDTDWEQGRKLASFEVAKEEETTDGSNLYIRVKRKFSDGASGGDAKVTYIVGTSPVVTIFPQ